MKRTLVIAVLGSVACGRIGFDMSGSPTDGLPTLDAPFPTGPFGTPVRVVELGTEQLDDDPSLTGDQLEIYFESERTGSIDIYVATRATLDTPWSIPIKVSDLEPDSFEQGSPRLSYDGLSLYFARNNLSYDTFVTTRATRSDPWATAVLVPELSTIAVDTPPTRTPSELLAYLASNEAGNSVIFVSTRSSTADLWEPPVRDDSLDSPGENVDPFVTNNGLVVYLVSTRDTLTNLDLYVATRTSLTEPFGTPVPLPELNSPFDEHAPWVSPDGHTIYFAREDPAGGGIFMATR